MPPSFQEVETLTPPLTAVQTGIRPGGLEKETSPSGGLCELEAVRLLAPFGPQQVLIHGNFCSKDS